MVWFLEDQTLLTAVTQDCKNNAACKHPYRPQKYFSILHNFTNSRCGGLLLLITFF